MKFKLEKEESITLKALISCLLDEYKDDNNEIIDNILDRINNKFDIEEISKNEIKEFIYKNLSTIYLKLK